MIEFRQAERGTRRLFCAPSLLLLLMFPISFAHYTAETEEDQFPEYRLPSGEYHRIKPDHDAMDDAPAHEEEIYVPAHEEERYVPATFEMIDLHNGFQRPIELMMPIELTEDESLGGSRMVVSELEHRLNTSSPLESPTHTNRGRNNSPTADNSGGRESNCGGRLDIDRSMVICCSGLVYLRSSVVGGRDESSGRADAAQCCGHVAYDTRYFICCQDRYIVRRTGVLPVCCQDRGAPGSTAVCNHGYEQDRTGLGSICCRSSPTSSWRCCLKSESCCSNQGDDRSQSPGGSAIDVPGFRPVCCSHLTAGAPASTLDRAAECCAQTFERMRLLPDCCDTDRLRPTCCRRPSDGHLKCCSATFGYCCGRSHIASPLATTTAPVDPRLTAPRYVARPSVSSGYRPYIRPTLPSRPWTPYQRPSPLTGRPCTPDLRPSPFTGRPCMSDSRPTPFPGRPPSSALDPTASSQELRCCCCTVQSALPCCRSASSQTTCCRIATYNPNVCCLRRRSSDVTTAGLRHPVADNSDQETSVTSEATLLPVVDNPTEDAENDEAARSMINDQAPYHGRRRSHGFPTNQNNVYELHRQEQLSCCGKTEEDLKVCCREGLGVTNGRRSPDCCRPDPVTHAVVQPSTTSRPPGITDRPPSDRKSKRKLKENRTKPKKVETKETNPAGKTATDENGFENSNKSTQKSRGVATPTRDRAVVATPTRDRAVVATPTRVSYSKSKATNKPAKHVKQKRKSDQLKTKKRSKTTGIPHATRSTVGADVLKTCNGTTFDADEHICCNKSLRKRIGFSPACCGSVAYDTILYKCCDGASVRMSCSSNYKPKQSVWGVPV